MDTSCLWRKGFLQLLCKGKSSELRVISTNASKFKMSASVLKEDLDSTCSQTTSSTCSLRLAWLTSESKACMNGSDGRKLPEVQCIKTIKIQVFVPVRTNKVFSCPCEKLFPLYSTCHLSAASSPQCVCNCTLGAEGTEGRGREEEEAVISGFSAARN